jgi:radical SAM superfamily enzyme YgiQ (UPF0313 family)
LRGPGDILFVSCYELGRQPAAVASAMAGLDAAGFSPRALDVSIDRLDEAALRSARLVAISVPMHTALRLGVQVARRARELNPAARVAFFGLYATLNAPHLLALHGDYCIGGESDEPLRALAAALDAGAAERIAGVATRDHPEGPWLPRAKQVRRDALVPLRAGLPPLGRYAKLKLSGREMLVATVEASRGCKHLCRHCPIVPVYAGRFFALPREAVLGDIEQQLAQGARHVTFADPDFLNGPRHALDIASELHRRWPDVTFDATIKIEHLLQHRALLPDLAASGCLFITSAVESLSDRVLLALDKGHTAADVPAALQAVRAAGIDLRPTLLPYTPWTDLAGLRALFDFADEHDLVDEIEPVQFTLRLLLPPGSPLVEGAPPWLGPFESQNFSWTWAHEDERVDELQCTSAAIAARAAERGAPQRQTFAELRSVVDAEAARRPSRARRRAPHEVPRLTETWFC